MSVLVAGVVVSFFLGFALGQKGPSAGGSVHNTQESFDAGIAVNQTEVIDSSGAFTDHVSSSNLVEGGTLLELSAATTLTGSQLCSVNVISATSTASKVDFTVILPAATSTAAAADCLGTNGDSITLFARNSLATNTVTFAVNAAISKGIYTTKTGTTSLALQPGSNATLRFTRFSATELLFHWIFSE